MSRHEKLYNKIKRNPGNVKWKDFYALCVHYFGEPVRRKGSHITFAPRSWAGRGTLPVQPQGKQAKEYQVQQALRLIEEIRRGDS